jgi:hypothetical protein
MHPVDPREVLLYYIAELYIVEQERYNILVVHETEICTGALVASRPVFRVAYESCHE